MEVQRVLLSLDDLLDTRLATLAKHFPEYVKGLLENGNLDKWCNRVFDRHDDIGLTPEEFKRLYRERNTDLLKVAKPTHFFSEIDDFAAECLSRAIIDPHKVKSVEIHLNTYPYVLTEDQITAFCSLLHAHTNERLVIVPVRLRYQDLTPGFIRSKNYAIIYMYDFYQWVLHHYNPMISDTREIYMPDVAICAPALFHSMEGLREAVEYTNPNGETYDPNGGLQFMFKAFFSLQLYNVEFFSLAKESAMKRILMRNFEIEYLRSEGQ